MHCTRVQPLASFHLQTQQLQTLERVDRHKYNRQGGVGKMDTSTVHIRKGRETHRLVIKQYCNNKMTKQHDNSQTIQQQLKHQTYRHLEITVLASLIKCHFLIVCSFLLQIWFSWCTAGIHGQAKPSFPRAESIQSQLESRWHTVGLLFMDSLNNK